MKYIISYLEKEVNQYKNYKFEEQEKLDLFSNFINLYDIKINTIENYLNLKYSELMVVLLCLKKEISVEDAKKIVEPVKKLLDNIDFNDDNSPDFVTIIKIIYRGYGKMVKQKCKRNSIFQKDEFLQFIDEVDDVEIFDYLATIGIIKTTYEELCELDDSTTKENAQKAVVAGLKQSEGFKCFYNEVYISLQKKVKILWKRKNKEEEYAKKLCSTYETILTEIKKEGIIQYSSALKQIPDELQIQLMISIGLHNEKLYKKLTKEYLDMKNNPDYLKKIFSANGYDMSKISKQQFIQLSTYGDMEKISKILPIIKESPFQIRETDYYFIKVLLYSDISIINKIKEYCDKSILNEKFIINYPDILISNKYKNTISINYSYETLITNIDYLLSKNLNIKNIRKTNPNMLTINNQELKNNISRLESYGINFNNQKNNNYKYITLNKTLILIDKFIELGLNEYIKDNIEELVANGELIIKRIYIAKKIGLNIWNEFNKLDVSILNGYNFPVIDRYLEDLIANATESIIDKKITSHFNNSVYEITPLINLLDSKFLYNDNYSFGNVIISRNKVIRNLSSINYTINLNTENINKILLNAIIHNSILEIDEIKTIEDIINTLLEKNKTKNKKLGNS